MDFFHSWLYVHVLNTRWMLWVCVAPILGGNVLGMLLLGLVIQDTQGLPGRIKARFGSKRSHKRS